MTASQMRIAETIDAFYGDAGANDGVSRSYKQAVEELDAETIKALDGPFRYEAPPGIDAPPRDEPLPPGIESPSPGLTPARYQRNVDYFPEFANLEQKMLMHILRQTVLEPISRFCNYFPDINECAYFPSPLTPTPPAAARNPSVESLANRLALPPYQQASKNVTTNSSTTMPPAPVSKSSSKNLTKTPPSSHARSANPILPKPPTRP